MKRMAFGAIKQGNLLRGRLMENTRNPQKESLTDLNLMRGHAGPEMSLFELAETRGKQDGIIESRKGPPAQMLEMAARYGLEPGDIATPLWRAIEIVDTCRHCDKADNCFDFFLGVRDGTFSEPDCPNAERYTEASLESSKTR